MFIIQIHFVSSLEKIGVNSLKPSSNFKKSKGLKGTKPMIIHV